MHPTAMKHADLFFRTYLADASAATVVDIGAQDVNGSLKQVCPPGCKYIGVDFIAGRNVDVVLDDPYSLPFDDQSVDVVVSSSCLEHSEMFWLLFLEMLRILKPHGLLYLNAPSNGSFHRYPVDCWRFYPDSASALVTWAKRSGYDPLLLESFTGRKGDTGRRYVDDWNDFVAVFLKDAVALPTAARRILDAYEDFDNGYVHGNEGLLHAQAYPEGTRNHFALLDEMQDAARNRAKV